MQPAVGVYVYNLSTWVEEAGEIIQMNEMSLRPPWSTVSSKAAKATQRNHLGRKKGKKKQNPKVFSL